MVTGNNIILESELQSADQVEQRSFLSAPLYKRIFAYIIDLAITASAVLYYLNSFSGLNAFAFITDENVFLTYLITVVVFYQSYFFISEYLWKGKTVGKYLLNIRVISLSNNKIDLSLSFIRNFCRIINFLPPVFFIPDLVCIFISRDHRSIADYIAGTVVITNKEYHRKMNYSSLDKKENLD